MSVVLYFGFMGLVVMAGFTILGLTFRQWYLDARARRQQQGEM